MDIDSPHFPAINKHLNTFTNQQNPLILRLKSFNFCLGLRNLLKFVKNRAETETSSLNFEASKPASNFRDSSAQDFSNKHRNSFQNILKLSLSSKIQKKMMSDDPLLIKNIRFREEKELINCDNCTICFLSFTPSRPRFHWFFL